MGKTILVSKHLEIELMSSSDNSDPALRIYTPNIPEQSFVVFLSEVHLLRDALVKAGTELAEIEKEARRRRL